MIRTLDASMLNLPFPAAELAPLAAKYGFEALSQPSDFLSDPDGISAVMKENGISGGLLPMPADFYHWDLDDSAFEKKLEELRRRAEIAERTGIRFAYNHVWPSSFREFDENFDWHVKRVGLVSGILRDHGVRYGLEFLGPHELRRWQKHEFVHSLAGVLSIADAAGEIAGIALDTFHWYTSSGGAEKDLKMMELQASRLVCVHLNDAVAGVPFEEQKDMERRLPMETGVIDSRGIFRRFRAAGADALYMIEPFEPARTKFRAMSPEEAVRTAAEAMEKVE
ncbi:MAG: sugar phosphate isomerase/epimerase [Clostridia bacterium]|nr:sugar phosphate isomerase/epimerase [Clostridia bacterium]